MPVPLRLELVAFLLILHSLEQAAVPMIEGEPQL